MSYYIKWDVLCNNYVQFVKRIKIEIKKSFILIWDIFLKSKLYPISQYLLFKKYEM